MPEPIAKWNPNRDCWESLESLDLLSEHSDVYSETFPSSGMTRNGLVYELRMPAHLMDDSESLLLPTPTAMNPNATEDIENWLARRERVKATSANGNGFGMPLGVAVRLLPTPVASEGTKATNRQNAAQKAKTGQVWLTNVAHTIREQSGASTNPPSGGGSPLWEE